MAPEFLKDIDCGSEDLEPALPLKHICFNIVSIPCLLEMFNHILGCVFKLLPQPVLFIVASSVWYPMPVEIRPI